VGDRLEFRRFSLERCRRQIHVERDVDDRFEFERFSLERCGRQVPIGTVNMECCHQTHLHEHLINGGGTRHYKASTIWAVLDERLINEIVMINDTIATEAIGCVHCRLLLLHCDGAVLRDWSELRLGGIILFPLS
jgi:hypothetical protein